MYRYDTTFAFPVRGVPQTYKAYDAEMVIRNDADGKSYLYDLLDIEKKKVISAAPFSAETHSEVFAPKPSTNNISTSGEKVNGKFSLKDMDSAYLAAVERGDTEAAQNAKTAAGEGSGVKYSIKMTEQSGNSDTSAVTNSIPAASRNVNAKFSLKGMDRDYSYSALVRKPEMRLTQIAETSPGNRADIIRETKPVSDCPASRTGEYNRCVSQEEFSTVSEGSQAVERKQQYCLRKVHTYDLQKLVLFTIIVHSNREMTTLR